MVSDTRAGLTESIDMALSSTPAGHFNLLYFATAASYTTKTSETLPAPLSVTKLFETLENKYPGIRDKVLSSCAVAVNLDYIDLDDAEGCTLKEGDEVAIIPPVSSG